VLVQGCRTRAPCARAVGMSRAARSRRLRTRLCSRVAAVVRKAAPSKHSADVVEGGGIDIAWSSEASRELDVSKDGPSATKRLSTSSRLPLLSTW